MQQQCCGGDVAQRRNAYPLLFRAGTLCLTVWPMPACPCRNEIVFAAIHFDAVNLYC